MSLITCPECGKEISDKAVSCPNCGYPVSEDESVRATLNFELIADEIQSRNSNETKAIKELREATGVDLKTALDAMDRRYKGYTIDEKRKKQKEERAQLRQDIKQNNRDILNSLNTLASLSAGSKVAKCPKCRSTSISYTNKKLSIGRAVVGGAVAGGAGAVIGGLSSKKGYAVCLNCGKQWRI